MYDGAVIAADSPTPSTPPLGSGRRRRSMATAVLLTGIGLGALVLGAGWLALVLTWLLLLRSMPAPTRVRQGFLAGTTMFGVNAGLLTIAAVAGWRTTPDALAVGDLALGLGLVLGSRGAAPPTRLCDRVDAWCLGYSALAFAVLYRPFLGASTGKTMALLSKTTDGATHVEVVRAVTRAGGYVNLTHTTGLYPGVNHYPAAWAGNVWAGAGLILGRAPDSGETIRAVAIVAIASYASLCFLALSASLQAVTSGQGRLSQPLAFVVAVTMSLATLVGFATLLLHLDSYPQVTAMVLITALAVLPRVGAGTTLSYLVVAAACCIGVAQTWYLLLPVVVAVAAVGVSRWRPPRRALVFTAAPTALVCAYPVLTGPSGVRQVNLPGPHLLPTTVGILGLLVASLFGVFYLLRGRGNQHAPRLELSVTVVVALLATTLVVAIESTTGSGFNYYAGKLLLATFFFGVLGGVALVGHGVAPGAAAAARLCAAVVLISLVAGSWSTRSLTWPPSPTKLTPSSDVTVLDAVYAAHPDGLPRGTDAWVVEGCDRNRDKIASKWVYDLSLGWDASRDETLREFEQSKPQDLSALAARAASPEVSTMEVFFHRQCQPAALASLARDPKVRVIHVP